MGDKTTKGSGLSSNLMNMKFMQRASPAAEHDEPEKPVSAPLEASAGGWSMPNAQKMLPKRAYQSPVNAGFAQLQTPRLGRMVWKNGEAKQVETREEEQPWEEPPEPRKDAKKDTKRKRDSSKPKRDSSRVKKSKRKSE